MGIQIGYEPVGAIGELAYKAGAGKKSEYDDAIARQQAQRDADQNMQMKLAQIKDRLQRDSWGVQAKRDNTLHNYSMDELQQRGINTVAGQRAQLERQKQVAEQQQTNKTFRDLMDGKLVVRPEYQKQ